jgi:hypothetical protein
MTLAVYSVMVAYIWRMGTMLITREDPNVWSFNRLDHYKSSDLLQLNQIGFKMAFGVYDYKNNKHLNDPSMHEW